MQQAFDTIAQQYDISFTNSLIGTAQRQIVWNYLEKSLPKNKKLKVLELNCGTGEDAIWFAKQGYEVLATDVSDKMLAIAQKKIEDAGMEAQVQTRILDIINIECFDVKESYDLVFSNFGGINCVSPEILNKAIPKISSLLNSNGRLIMVMMPSFCLWETIYFLVKLKFREAFRRVLKSAATVNLSGTALQIYYYSLRNLTGMFNDIFNTIAIKPVGFFLPPSYLEKFFNKHRTQFFWLNKLEYLIRNRKFLSGLSDHYLIDFRLK